MSRKHLKITLISILITSTLFNSANENFANADEDTDENHQEYNDIDDGVNAPADEEEMNTGDFTEDETVAGDPVDEGTEEHPREIEEDNLLKPVDPMDGEGIETILTEPEVAEIEPEQPAEPVEEEPLEPEQGETPAEEAPEAPVDDGEGTDGSEEEAPDETEQPVDGGNMNDDAPVFPEPGESDEAAQPGQDENFIPEDQFEQPVEDSVQNENPGYYTEPSEETADTWNVEEYAGEESDAQPADQADPGVAGKKLYRYNYGDILDGIDFSPGSSDDSLALLDKRVNLIMTSKIFEEDELSEEDMMNIEEKIKNESGITSSDRETLPNTGEASNYNYLYSVMLVLAGSILFFITKRPHQQ